MGAVVDATIVQDHHHAAGGGSWPAAHTAAGQWSSSWRALASLALPHYCVPVVRHRYLRLAREAADLRLDGPDRLYPSDALDTVRIRVTGTDPATPLFVRIPREADVAVYLAGAG